MLFQEATQEEVSVLCSPVIVDLYLWQLIKSSSIFVCVVLYHIPIFIFLYGLRQVAAYHWRIIEISKDNVFLHLSTVA